MADMMDSPQPNDFNQPDPQVAAQQAPVQQAPVQAAVPASDAVSAAQDAMTPAAPATPGAPPVSNPGLLTKIMQVIAGHPAQAGAHYDPTTGQQVAQPETTKKTLAEQIVIHALAGAFRSMGAPPGPGHVGQGAALAFQGGMADQQRLRDNEQQNFERQQQAQVQQYQLAHLNAQTALDGANAQSAGLAALEKAKSMNEDAVQQLGASGSIETDVNGLPVTLTKDDILQKVKSGELNPGDSIGMLYGGTLVNEKNPVNGKDESKPIALYTINKDPNAPIHMSEQMYNQLTGHGANIPKEVIGQDVPAKTYSAWFNQASVHFTGDAVLATLRHDAGDNGDLSGKLPQNLDPNTPGLATSLRLLQQALRGSNGDIYKGIETVYQKSPQSGTVLMQALGGKDNIADIAAQHQSTLKANAAGEEAQARVDIENGKPVPGQINGQGAFGVYQRTGPNGGPAGWYTANPDPKTGQRMPIANFTPAPQYSAIIQGITEQKMQAQTKALVAPDGVTHDYGWNPKTHLFDVDMGVSGSGTQGGRLFASGTSAAAGDDLVNDIKTTVARNPDVMGHLMDWAKTKGLNTPFVGDADTARLYAELVSFAALQPAQHGFRSSSAMETFENLVGGLQKNPNATIATIQGIKNTTSRMLPKVAPGVHPTASYQFLTPDGKQGWNGTAWVPVVGGK